MRTGRPLSYPEPRVQLHARITLDSFKLFSNLARRENMTNNELLDSLIQNFIKVHGAGNDSYKLTEFDHGLVRAYPTVWKKWTEKDVQNLTEAEAKEMVALLLYNLSIIRKKAPERASNPTPNRERAEALLKAIPK